MHVESFNNEDYNWLPLKTNKQIKILCSTIHVGPRLIIQLFV